MVNHAEIIRIARTERGNLFDFPQKGDVLAYHMKMMNTVLLTRLPNFQLGSVFFPTPEDLVKRLAEAYLNDRRLSTLEEASNHAEQDLAAIRNAVAKAFGEKK